MKKKGQNAWIIRIILIVVITMIGILIIISNEIVRPVRRDEQVATKIAKTQGKLHNVTSVMRFNHGAPQYTVVGLNPNNQKILLNITDSGKKLNFYLKKSGISSETATKIAERDTSFKHLTTIAFGVLDNKPVWDVSYLNKSNQLVIKTVNFKTGKVLKTINTYEE